MKKWRVIYWLGLNKTEWIVRAETKDDAREKFKKEKGENVEIIQIGETEETAHN